MKNIYGYIALLSCTALMVSSCGSSEPQEEKKVEETPLVKVTVASTKSVVDDMTYSSTVQAWAKNNIAPQQGGRIEKLLVEVGDYVTEGQIVAYMEDVQLQQSELQVKNDEIEYSRLKSLKEKGGVSQSDFDAFEMACKVHKTQYENLLRNTVLRSPITGVISSRNYDKGDMYGMSQPLYTVEQVVPVKLLISISESYYSKVKKGQSAVITADAFPDKTFSGQITNIYPTIDPISHTFQAEVKVANPYKTLRPGMYAKVNLIFGEREQVIIPDVAVTKQVGSAERYVYILDESNNTVHYSLVELGRRVGNEYVVLSGVKAGDKVVTEGILRLKNGVKVNVAK